MDHSRSLGYLCYFQYTMWFGKCQALLFHDHLAIVNCSRFLKAPVDLRLGPSGHTSIRFGPSVLTGTRRSGLIPCANSFSRCVIHAPVFVCLRLLRVLWHLICPIAVPLLTLASSIQAETQMSSLGSLWHRRCCAYTRAAVITLLTHATTYGRHTATQVTLALRFNYVKKTDAIGYIANQTNEYPYTQSILVYTQVCKRHTSVYLRIHRHDSCMGTHVHTGMQKLCHKFTWDTPNGGHSHSCRLLTISYFFTKLWLTGH